MLQYAGCRKDVPCSRESACFYQSTRKCAFLLPFCILRHRPSFLKLWGYGEDAIACRNTLGVARTCLARASPLASTKAHASVLFLLLFCILRHRPSFLKLWGFGEDAIACRNTLGVAGVACSHESACFYQSTRKCAFFVAVLHFTPLPLFFLKVLVEDKILYGVNAIKFNVDMPFCLFTKTVQ